MTTKTVYFVSDSTKTPKQVLFSTPVFHPTEREAWSAAFIEAKRTNLKCQVYSVTFPEFTCTLLPPHK